MNAQNNRPVQSQNEQSQVMTFNFSESKSEIRNVFVNNEPHFIGSDVANALGYKNSRKAIKDHCRYVTNSYIPHPQSEAKKLQVSVIPESDVYRLIMKSTLPTAQKFERWVMEEVLPAVRKKGYYATSHAKQDYIDARDIPFIQVLINEKPIRCIELEKINWFSMNDYHTSIGSRTSSGQTAKKLNHRQPLAAKIWLFGATNPSWFTTELGLQLIASGSRIFTANQLKLSL